MLMHPFDALGKEEMEVLFVARAVSGSDRAVGRREKSGWLHPFREGHGAVGTEL